MSQYVIAKFLQSAKHRNHVSPGSRGPEKMVYKNPLGHKYIGMMQRTRYYLMER